MRFVVLLSLALSCSAAYAGETTEVLVSNVTPTKLPANPLRRGLLIENRGPNPIWCALTSATAIVGKSHKVEGSGGRFPFNAPDAWWCIAETAAQVTGGGTVVSEVI